MLLALARLSQTFSRQRLSTCRHLSGGGEASFHIGQGGRLSVAMPKATAVVRVTTEWVDACRLTISQLPSEPTDFDCSDVGVLGTKKIDLSNLGETGLALEVDEGLIQLTIAHDQETAATYLVEAVVPELFSVKVVLAHGSVSVAKKLKGDCEVQLETGNIDVGVVRGEGILLSTGGGHVHVDELEGNVDITATADVRARLINGAKVNIDSAGDDASVTVGSIYSSGARISSAGSVIVPSCHGRISVHAAGPAGDVTLSSVNGTAQVVSAVEPHWAGDGDVRLHVDVLEEGTNSRVRSDRGDIRLSMSQGVTTDIDITGNISELPSTFEGNIQGCKAVGTIVCAGMGRSPESLQGSGGGKIDLAGARDQSLRQYFKKDSTGRGNPTLSVTASDGSVGVETLSWADNITRKFTWVPNTP